MSSIRMRSETHDEVYSVPLRAPRADIEMTMAKSKPPTGPASARPKSRPIVVVAVAMSKGRTRKYDTLAARKRTTITAMLLLIMSLREDEHQAGAKGSPRTSTHGRTPGATSLAT